MMNDIENTETIETRPNKVRWTATVAGYAFVIAMGSMAIWVGPSTASLEAHTSSALATAPFTAFAGSGTERVVLGQPAGTQLADVSSAHREVSALDHSQLKNLDLTRTSNPAPMAVPANN